MDDCIERCCRSSNADVAYMLGPFCFAVKCQSREMCKPSPAMYSDIKSLNLNPAISFLKKDMSQMQMQGACLFDFQLCITNCSSQYRDVQLIFEFPLLKNPILLLLVLGFIPVQLMLTLTIPKSSFIGSVLLISSQFSIEVEYIFLSFLVHNLLLYHF